jgi:hypothetical protein
MFSHLYVVCRTCACRDHPQSSGGLIVDFVNSYCSSRSSISSNLAALTLIAHCKASAFGTGDMHESPPIHKGFTACYARRPGGEVRRGEVVPMGDQVRTLLDGVDVPRRNTGTAARPCEEQRSPSRRSRISLLDEADRMLDMGFIHDIRKIVAKLPTTQQRKAPRGLPAFLHRNEGIKLSRKNLVPFASGRTANLSDSEEITNGSPSHQEKRA